MRSRFVLLAALCIVGLSTVTRLVLLLLVHADLTASPAAIARALLVGTAFDLVVAAWLTVPLSLYLALVTERWYQGRFNRAILRAVLAGGSALGLFVATAEVLFFDEFNGRFNFVAVDYLLYPTEVTTNIWQSYHTGWILAAIVAVAVLVPYLLRGWLAATVALSTRRRHRFGGLATHVGLLAGLSAAVTPGLARVSGDRALNEVASNGWYTFWLALTGHDAPYEGLYAADPAPLEEGRLPRLLDEAQLVPGTLEAHSTLRFVSPDGPEVRLNVVVVLEESLGATLVGATAGGATSLTPRFDSLAAEGTLLTNAYATGNRTIRALEAVTASIPPLPGISLVRRPASHDLFTLPGVLRSEGYATAFIYGGRALFDGMGAYMLSNGMERVVEQSDYPDTAFRTA